MEQEYDFLWNVFRERVGRKMKDISKSLMGRDRPMCRFNKNIFTFSFMLSLTFLSTSCRISDKMKRVSSNVLPNESITNNGTNPTPGSNSTPPNSGSVAQPTVIISQSNPTQGDIVTSFSFDISITDASTVNLTTSKVILTQSGVSCSTLAVNLGNSLNPKVVVSGCSGDGSFTIVIGADIAFNSANVGNLASGSSAQVTVLNPIVCPSGYIKVPSDGVNTSKDFCVMQFEAKAFDGVSTYDADGAAVNLTTYKPASVADNGPWRFLTKNDAIAECRSLNTETVTSDIDADLNGDGIYDLVTNSEWQNVAQNIEQQDINWTGGTVGSGCIAQGNTGASNICNYTASSSPDFGLTVGRDTKAMHRLSNNQEIWDFSGNVWEWVKDDSLTFNYGADAYVSTFLSGGSVGPQGTVKQAFGPIGDYSTHTVSTFRAGLGYLWLNPNAGSILRGGSWSSNVQSGIFAARLLNSSTTGANTVGFRCSYNK